MKFEVFFDLFIQCFIMINLISKMLMYSVLGVINQINMVFLTQKNRLNDLHFSPIFVKKLNWNKICINHFFKDFNEFFVCTKKTICVK